MKTVTKDDLISLGFKEHRKINQILPTSMVLDISRPGGIFRQISINPTLCNQTCFIREGDPNKPRHEDDLVCLWNYDYDGDLSLDWVKNLLKLFKKN